MIPPLPFGLEPYAFDLKLGIAEFEAAIVGEARLDGRTLDRWFYERQRDAFAALRVRMERSDRWR